MKATQTAQQALRPSCLGKLARWCSIGMLSSAVTLAHAGGGPLGIDHALPRDESGVWKPRYQTGLEYGVVALGAGGALWLGNDDPLGHVFWQSLDSMALASATAYAAKYAFSRPRPVDAPDAPNQWFKGGSSRSFPSGAVTLQASFVTPFIVNYARENPWVWSLELLPVYTAVGRVKNQEHWQTDVLAGWLLGSAIGYYTTTRDIPFTVQILPHGFMIGFSKRL